MSDKFGRKATILIADVLFAVGALVMGFAWNILMLVLGRLIVGFGIGIAAMSVPLYLAETAPTQIRGAIVAVNVMFITGG